MLFWNSLAFSLIQQMLATWSLVPLPFRNPAWTSESCCTLYIIYCWNLAWRILSITLLVCEMNAMVQYFEHSLALPFFGIGMKTDFSISVATAGFSKFADILSAGLWQHHVLGFDIAIVNEKKKDVQLESCELSFIWGKLRTEAQEAASQIALRDCSKGAVGKSQYIRFWWREFYAMKRSFYKRFLWVIRIWGHHEGI